MKPEQAKAISAKDILLDERAVGSSCPRALAQWAIVILSLTYASSAAAYVGPGAGLTAIGTFIALVSTIILGIVGFVWYPIKRLLRRFKRNKRNTAMDNLQAQKEHEV